MDSITPLWSERFNRVKDSNKLVTISSPHWIPTQALIPSDTIPLSMTSDRHRLLLAGPITCRNRTTQQRRLRVSMEHTHMWVGSLVVVVVGGKGTIAFFSLRVQFIYLSKECTDHVSCDYN